MQNDPEMEIYLDVDPGYIFGELSGIHVYITGEDTLDVSANMCDAVHWEWLANLAGADHDCEEGEFLDLVGREVLGLHDGETNPGLRSLTIPDMGLAAGVYFLRLIVDVPDMGQSRVTFPVSVVR